MENCKLSGDTWQALYDIPALQVLGIAGNDEITGTLSGIEKLINLRELYTGMTGMTGPIPEEMGTMKSLRFIKSDGTQLTGVLPSSLGDLTELEELDFALNQLDGALPESLGGLTKLERVALYGNGE